eukprot:CAMPEP_0201283484 /NCGR_PEP_ID=MMETSP1317-20130820/8677_1 /ASSEMBLY_ACC=CAM_ASM_000770 /TAXON_ID=187299 /ORGANISM="Undescribed Undescribed, Strain Undescribed" /LENGTH=54 /DNA_ID=CAMNT_0047599873 /DNA_START=525 /DNA_END=689 /DNA_ORIENTATION=-
MASVKVALANSETSTLRPMGVKATVSYYSAILMTVSLGISSVSRNIVSFAKPPG